MRFRRGVILLMGVWAVLTPPAVAEPGDAAYCAKLAELALRYTGRAGFDGEVKPTLTTKAAIDACDRGDFASGIPALEKTLRDNRFNLPPR